MVTLENINGAIEQNAKQKHTFMNYCKILMKKIHMCVKSLLSLPLTTAQKINEGLDSVLDNMGIFDPERRRLYKQDAVVVSLSLAFGQLQVILVYAGIRVVYALVRGGDGVKK